jgi:hypothetical protein
MFLFVFMLKFVVHHVVARDFYFQLSLSPSLSVSLSLSLSLSFSFSIYLSLFFSPSVSFYLSKKIPAVPSFAT